jgi:hypothetical protein
MKFGDMATDTTLPAFELLVGAAQPGNTYASGTSGALNLTTFQMPWVGTVVADLHICWNWTGYQDVINWFVAGTQAPNFAPQARSLINGTNTYIVHTTLGFWYAVPAGPFTVTLWTGVGGGGPTVTLDSWQLNVRAART